MPSLFGATPNPGWKFTKSRELGTIAPSAILHSFSFKKGTGVEVEKAEINALAFQEKDFLLTVLDHPLENKSLREATQEACCMAGINGGYFQPDGAPLGLLMHAGKMIHPQERAAILSGFFVRTPHGMTLLRVGEIIPSDAIEILQAGPFLLDRSRPIHGLESTKKAYRSFVATNGNGLWIIGIISPVTLAEASHILGILHTKYISGMATRPLTRALNLDGGSSSSLLATTKPTPFSFREYVCVRNFLGLQNKEQTEYQVLN
ncbi:MAG: phosphodiester glycosidase family protein [Chthoniobacterales bacterium]